jgi:hypothetical protein
MHREREMNAVKIKRPPTYNADGTITIYLTKGYSAIIDDVDADLAEFNWNSEDNKWACYAVRRINRPADGSKSYPIYLHRVILERNLGRTLEADEVADHKDTNSLNNRRSNLRPATNTQNTQNQRKRSNCSSEYKGVTWSKASKKWQAAIKHQGKNYYLGMFDDPLEAHKRYIEKATELFGEYARAA